MNKNLLVKLRVNYDSDYEHEGPWAIWAKTSFKLMGCDDVCIAENYKPQHGAIKAAKRLLPLFVNAVLEE